MDIQAELSPEVTFRIDFHTYRVPAAQGIDVPPAAAAAMLGITEAQFEHHAADAASRVKQMAGVLLSRQEIARAVERLPVPVGGTVMAVGDSITAYRCSYAELLAAMLPLRRPGDRLRLINAALSGYTSAQGLEYVYRYCLPQQPDLVFVMYGVNDSKHYGSSQARMLISNEDYRANMAAIIQAFNGYTSARLVLLTPAPVLEEVIAALPDFAARRLSWRNADLQERAGLVRRLAEDYSLPCVDLMAAFGPNPDPSFYLPDGLHLGPTGQQVILEQLLKAISSDE